MHALPDLLMSGDMVDDYMLVNGLIGGALLGLSAALLFHFNGRIAGISGVLGGLLPPREDAAWRALFVATLIGGGALVKLLMPDKLGAPVQSSLPMVAMAGLLVGLGTRLGCGCTSGHGICGLARLSKRSLVATLTFIVSGALTVVLMRVISGGAA